MRTGDKKKNLFIKYQNSSRPFNSFRLSCFRYFLERKISKKEKRRFLRNRDCVCLSLAVRITGIITKFFLSKWRKELMNRIRCICSIDFRERFNLNAFIDQTKISKYCVYASPGGEKGLEGGEMMFVLGKYSIADHLSIFVGSKKENFASADQTSFMSVLKGLKGLSLQLIFSLLTIVFN